MNRTKSPQQRDLVAPAMTPVETDLADDHRRDHARPKRKIGGGAGKACWQNSVNHPSSAAGGPSRKIGVRLLMKFQTRLTSQPFWKNAAGRTEKKLSSERTGR
jgi:hypothetical protein